LDYYEEVLSPDMRVFHRTGTFLETVLGRCLKYKCYGATNQVLETYQPGGGYFLGYGNWITSYIPLDNYLAMLQAGREFPLQGKHDVNPD
jgi:hypothetical protein